MLKYRRLTTDELKDLEPEFIQFLAAQSITAPDWEKIKSEKIDKRDELIALFSNIVLEKVFTAIDYLEILTQDELRIFNMNEERGRLLGLKIGNKESDLREDALIDELFKDPNKLLSLQPKFYELKKKYDKSKAEEVFFLLNMGANITDSTLYTALNSLVEKQSEK
jgi:hypothetical protein